MQCYTSRMIILIRKRICFFLVCLLSLSTFLPASAQSAEKIASYQKTVRRILDTYLTGLGRDPSRYSIEVIKSNELNAYATIGRKMVVNTGLIEFLNTEAGLAFVIAHELGHVEEKHVYKSVARHGLFSIVKNYFFRESAVYDGINYFHSLHYSRKSEKSADRFAENLINKHYCNSPGKLEFFEKMSRNQKVHKVNEYFSTHPLSGTRLHYLREGIQDAGCKL